MGIIALGPCFESGLYAGDARGHVLKCLANHADDDRFECYPSYEFIAFTAGLGRSTAAKALKDLIRLGLIEIVSGGGGRRRTNRYRVNVALIEICRDRVRAAKKAAGADTDARLAAMEEARAECEAILGNRPANGRFPEEQNRPVEGGNRPVDDRETVQPLDPNLQKNLHLEKEARARGGSFGENPPRRASAGSARAERGAGEKGACERERGSAPRQDGDRGADAGPPGPKSAQRFSAERAGENPETVNERAEREARLIARWIASANSAGCPGVTPVDRFALLLAGLWAERREPKAAEIATAVLSASTAGLKKIVGWLDWAQLVRDGRETNTIEPIRHIVAATRDAPKGGAAPENLAARIAMEPMRRACAARDALKARLREEEAASAGDVPADASGADDPAADHPSADDAEAVAEEPSHHDPPADAA